MELSPYLYQLFVRPSWFTKRYIHDVIRNHFDFNGKTVLDFGAGTGSNCGLFTPDRYLGLDTDCKRVGYAKRLNPGYRFFHLSGSRLPVTPASLDYILVVAVLHHVSLPQIRTYLLEFRRVLKPSGKIIVMEPCFVNNVPLRNWFMACFDRGKHIRHEKGYIDIFEDQHYEVEVLRRFNKCFLYNELFLMARPKC